MSGCRSLSTRLHLELSTMSCCGCWNSGRELHVEGAGGLERGDALAADRLANGEQAKCRQPAAGSPQLSRRPRPTLRRHWQHSEMWWDRLFREHGNIEWDDYEKDYSDLPEEVLQKHRWVLRHAGRAAPCRACHAGCAAMLRMLRGCLRARACCCRRPPRPCPVWQWCYTGGWGTECGPARAHVVYLNT